MKKRIVNYFMNKIREKNKTYDEEKFEIINYGLESLYILLTKTIFIFSLAYFLNIFYEVLIFTVFYNFIRMPSFGLHATKSWMCWVSSTLIFITIPYLCSIYDLNLIIRLIIGVITVSLIFKNAPADTYKRPIIDKKLRLKYKFISTIIAILMIMCSLIIKDTFIHNALIMSLVVQCFMISPVVYKIFKLPYNNYKAYQTTV